MNFNGEPGILWAFVLYLAVMIGIGLYYCRKQKSLSSRAVRFLDSLRINPGHLGQLGTDR